MFLAVIVLVIIVLSACPLLLLAGVVAAGYFRAAMHKTGGCRYAINWNNLVEDDHDGIETARRMFGVEIEAGDCHFATKHEFDKMNVENHRARIDATKPEDMFPEGDRPRGDDDIASVKYFMNAVDVDPIMVLNHEGKKYVLDGVHRLCAAYLRDSPIKYCEYKTAGVVGGERASIDLGEKYAIFMMCILKDHYVLGACISAFAHRSLLKARGLTNVDLVIMCDDYIYEKYNRVLEYYFDRVINIKLSHYEISKKYVFAYDKYSSWIGYSLNKWQCLKYTEYNKILFLDIDILASTLKFYDLFTFNTPALYITSNPSHQAQCANSKEYYYKNIGTYDDYILNYTKYGSIDGGISLLEPSLATYDKYDVMTKKLYGNGIYSSERTGPDETSLFYYFVSNKTHIYDICVDYAVIPWDNRKYVNVAKSYNFLALVKPWNKPKYLSWDEEIVWRDIYDKMPHVDGLEELFTDTIVQGVKLFASYNIGKQRHIYNDKHILVYADEVDEITKASDTDKFDKIIRLDKKITNDGHGILLTNELMDAVEQNSES